MRTPMRRVLLGSAIAGGFTVLGIALSATAASADDPGSTSGQDGIVSGNQTGLTVTAPVDASGNQVTVIGSDEHQPALGQRLDRQYGWPVPEEPATTGQDGTGSGNQTDATAHRTRRRLRQPGHGHRHRQHQRVLGRHVHRRLRLGRQHHVGRGRHRLRQPDRARRHRTRRRLRQPGHRHRHRQHQRVLGQQLTGGSGSGGGTTSGEDGTASGNQTELGATAPVDASDNQVTVIGTDNTNESPGDTSTGGSGSGGGSTSGEDGTGSGNQTGLGATAPVDASGNQVTVIGTDNTNRVLGRQLHRGLRLQCTAPPPGRTAPPPATRPTLGPPHPSTPPTTRSPSSAPTTPTSPPATPPPAAPARVAAAPAARTAPAPATRPTLDRHRTRRRLRQPGHRHRFGQREPAGGHPR